MQRVPVCEKRIAVCGITGIVRLDEESVDAARLRKMTRALAHRGPDGEGQFLRGNVGLGHRRLSIIDLERGSQPMTNEDQSVWVTYNGEIYNFHELRGELQALGHRFVSNSDTEVVVHGWEQWGSDCVRRFRGMFAFAVVDLGKRRLLLARDHFGVKPLYYRITSKQLAFASELAAIRESDDHPPPGSLEAIELFLRYQYIPTPRTIYADVYKLPPAHVLEIDLGQLDSALDVRPKRYWDLRFEPAAIFNEADYLDRIDAVVQEVVTDSLVADVPFGVFLSGGIDSSLVALKMFQTLGRGIKAFTIGFDEETYSEVRYARQVVGRMGLQWEHEVVQPDALAVLPDLLKHYGEPFGDSSAIPTWYVCRLARQHVPMVLSGDGGDEAFGGYDSYRSWLQSIEQHKNHQLGRSGWKKSILKVLRAVGYDYDRFDLFSCERWQRYIFYVRRPWREQLWRPEFRHLIPQPCGFFQEAAERAPRCDPLSFVQYLDFQTYLPCDILTKVDVASMYHGLEVRPSLLDVRLVELAVKMPMAMRMHPNGDNTLVGKYALKATLGRYFPPEFVYRPKQGFAIPRDRWFFPNQSLRRQLEELIADPSSRLRELFDPAGMRRLLAEHRQGNDVSGPLWLILVLGLWLDQNRDVSFS